MITSWKTIFSSLAASMLLVSGPSFAQTPLMACESQQSLEQALTSEGGIMPDDCRSISVARLANNGRELCLMDLSQPEGGIISNLRDAASTDQWWVACRELANLAASAP